MSISQKIKTIKFPQKKLRKCNTCGYEAKVMYNTHKVYCSKTKKNKYCGTMRVVRKQ